MMRAGNTRRAAPLLVVVLSACMAAAVALVPAAPCIADADPIDTAQLERPWKQQREREIEVGRHAVHLREKGSRKEGLFSGMRFTAPLDRARTWELANTYTDVGQSTQGIKSVTILEQTPSRQVVRIEVEVLWITLALNFEVEQSAPESVRFRLANPEIGRYQGYCRFRDAPAGPDGKPATEMEFATWFKGARPVPVGLALMAERMVLLRGAKSFLLTCEAEAARQSK